MYFEETEKLGKPHVYRAGGGRAWNVDDVHGGRAHAVRYRRVPAPRCLKPVARGREGGRVDLGGPPGTATRTLKRLGPRRASLAGCRPARLCKSQPDPAPLPAPGAQRP